VGLNILDSSPDERDGFDVLAVFLEICIFLKKTAASSSTLCATVCPLSRPNTKSSTGTSRQSNNVTCSSLLWTDVLSTKVHALSSVTADPDAIRDFVGPLVSEPAAHPKSVTILDEMPLTPIGKIYKPALRVIATRKALEDTFARAGFGKNSFVVACNEERANIQLADRALLEVARNALIGMPIRYSVS
jgi:hypothetical protein